MDSSNELLGELLKNVSRSFYLTLRVLPAGLRIPIGLGYLLARAADTIADTTLIPPDRRLELLLDFRANVNGPHDRRRLDRIGAVVTELQRDPHERTLLQSLPPALDLLVSLPDFERDEVRAVVTTLTRGMEFDLTRFPPESSGQLHALDTIDELESYTYLVAGCVGEFWTKLSIAHTPALRGWNVAEMSATGIRFGKALQYTNILRDVPKDLGIGRCYLPRTLLAAHGLTPDDLLRSENSARARPVLVELMRNGLEHYRHAEAYLFAIPPNCGRERLACLWPILIGLGTFEILGRNARWLEAGHAAKVSRAWVKGTVALSLPVVGSDTVTKWWIDRLRKRAESEIRGAV